MADVFPQTHSTRAGVTTTNRPTIHLNEWKALPCLIKIAQIVSIYIYIYLLIFDKRQSI